jgi:glucose-1-phosphate adenylyltransferase
MMGADFFFGDKDSKESVGVGDHSKIKNAIIDKNAKIGSNVILSPDGLEDGWSDEALGVYVRDGILVVVKNAIVPSGTKIGT